MPQHLMPEAVLAARPVEFRVLTRNPKTNEDHEDVARMMVMETVVELERGAFASIERANFQIYHLGRLAYDSSETDNAYGHLWSPLAAPDMQQLRNGIEHYVSYLIDLVYAEHPFITLMNPDGSYEREVSDEDRKQGFERLHQSATPETQYQTAQIQQDPTLLQGLPESVREQALKKMQPAGGGAPGPVQPDTQPVQTGTETTQTAE